MSINSYTVGLVVSAAGITHHQSVWMTKTLRWISHAIDGGPITLMVAGITDHKKSAYGVPQSVRGKMLPPGVTMILLSGAKNLTRAEATIHRSRVLEGCDEVWCLPCSGQSNRLSKTRPAMSFWLGVSGKRGNIYKWVPPWVDAGEFPIQQKKELPWKTR